MSRAASSGRPRISPWASPPSTTRRYSRRGAPNFAVAIHGLDVHTEIAVSPEDDIELRRTRIVNRSRVRKVIEVTSYTEVVLATPAADASHPAFSNLFVQTEIARREQAILCTRRPRSPSEQVPWMFHLMAVHGAPATDDAPMKPIACASSAAATRRRRRRQCAIRRRSPAARARCSIRSPRSGFGSRSSPSRPRRSTWSTASPNPATPRSS